MSMFLSNAAVSTLPFILLLMLPFMLPSMFLFVLHFVLLSMLLVPCCWGLHCVERHGAVGFPGGACSSPAWPVELRMPCLQHRVNDCMHGR